MSEDNLRNNLIKLAYENPEIRQDVLPLVKQANQGLYANLTEAAQSYLDDVEKRLKQYGTFENMGRSGKEGWMMWFENAEINVQPGFEDQYPDLYENPPVVSFTVTILLKDWRKMRVDLSMTSGFGRNSVESKEFLTGAKASAVADFISTTVASNLDLG